MKMNTFTIGALAGISALALAVPVIAQISSAQIAGTSSSTTSTTAPPSFTRPIPTQQQVTDMAAKDAAFLKNVDAFVSVEKSAIQLHEDALTAAASIADDTQRQAAVLKANTDERTSLQTALTANPDLQSAMIGLGHHGRGFGWKGGFGHHHGRPNDNDADDGNAAASSTSTTGTPTTSAQ